MWYKIHKRGCLSRISICVMNDVSGNKTATACSAVRRDGRETQTWRRRWKHSDCLMKFLFFSWCTTDGPVEISFQSNSVCLYSARVYVWPGPTRPVPLTLAPLGKEWPSFPWTQYCVGSPRIWAPIPFHAASPLHVIMLLFQVRGRKCFVKLMSLSTKCGSPFFAGVCHLTDWWIITSVLSVAALPALTG